MSAKLEDAVLLRAFFSEDDKSDGLPLYEAILLKAREMHLAGATVLRGPIGFGHSNRIHTAKIQAQRHRWISARIEARFAEPDHRASPKASLHTG